MVKYYFLSCKEIAHWYKKECVTLELQYLLRNQEIIYKTSTPYIYQQNGCTEWLNYTLLEKI